MKIKSPSLKLVKDKAKTIESKAPPLSKREAQTKINEIAKESSAIFYGTHGAGQKNIRDFTLSDIVEILRDGIIREDPRLGQYGDWCYKIEAHKFRGGRGAAVVTIIQDSKNKLFVKTVMWID